MADEQVEAGDGAAAAASRDLANFIIDLSDEDCPDPSLHLAAYNGDAGALRGRLGAGLDPEARVRPFLATPLRLAATAGSDDSVRVLLEHGAAVDEVDVKMQTPLFVALVNKHWECARLLLEGGADPNGNDKNMCTPLSVMSQRGYYEGVKLLCQYGADTEDVYRLMMGMPGLPVAIAATYHHLRCFAALLLFGARPGLAEDLEGLPPYVTTQCSVPHAIIKYRCPPEFVHIFREFGGSLWTKDSRDRLATEISDSAPALEVMKQLQGTPLSLQSCCRLAVRRALTRPRDERRLQAPSGTPGLGVSRALAEFLTFKRALPPSPTFRTAAAAAGAAAAREAVEGTSADLSGLRWSELVCRTEFDFAAAAERAAAAPTSKEIFLKFLLAKKPKEKRQT